MVVTESSRPVSFVALWSKVIRNCLALKTVSSFGCGQRSSETGPVSLCPCAGRCGQAVQAGGIPQ
eukprot:1474074-Rhodomonas_salina.2